MSTSHKREIVIKNGRNRASRPKTWATQAGADAWAKAAGIKKYTVVAAKKNRFSVVEE